MSPSTRRAARTRRPTHRPEWDVPATTSSPWARAAPHRPDASRHASPLENEWSRRVAYGSIAAAIQQAADPANRNADRHRRRSHVRHPPERERAPVPVSDRSNQAAKNAPVEDIPTFPAPEDVVNVVNCIQMREYVNPTSAHNPPEKEPGRQLVNDVGIDFLTARMPHADRQGCKTGHEDHDPVAMYLEFPARNDKQDWPHPCVSSSSNSASRPLRSRQDDRDGQIAQEQMRLHSLNAVNEGVHANRHSPSRMVLLSSVARRALST
jgi:hypothetical protein